MSFEIRKADIRDAADIARVDIDSHLEAYRHIFGDGYMANATFETFVERWERFIRGDPDNPRMPEYIYVAAVDGVVTGYAGFGRSRDDDSARTAEIHAIYVHPSLWRNGIGRTLLRESLEALKQLGYREVTLWALAENGIGRAFYEREGWYLDGATLTPDHGHLEVRYRRGLEDLLTPPAAP